MPAEPRKIFDLMDTETEPTDEQLAELMQYVGEAVRAQSAKLTPEDRQEIEQVRREAAAFVASPEGQALLKSK
jgi:hypothetical protein